MCMTLYGIVLDQSILPAFRFDAIADLQKKATFFQAMG